MHCRFFILCWCPFKEHFSPLHPHRREGGKRACFKMVLFSKFLSPYKYDIDSMVRDISLYLLRFLFCFVFYLFTRTYTILFFLSACFDLSNRGIVNSVKTCLFTK